MIGSTDWTGIAAVITALFGGIAAVVAAYFAAGANSKTRTPDGSPSIGQLATNVAAAVTTPPNAAPLGQVMSDVAQTIEHVHDAVCDPKVKPAQP